MKILMLGWELPPYNSGGLGVACYELARSLTSYGAEIDFVLPAHTEYNESSFMNIVHASHVSGTNTSPNTTTPSQVSNPYAGDYKQVRAVQKQYTSFVEHHVAENPPSVIHANDWLTLEAGVKAKQITGAPLVAHVHATEFDRAGGGRGNPLIHDIEQECLLMADHIVAVSKATKHTLQTRYHIPADKIEVIHNSTAVLPEYVTDMVQYRYIEHLKSEGYMIVGTMGRLTLQKGLTHFLRAAAKAHSRHERMLFIIAGDGEQRNELIQLTADLGIADSVVFTGFVRGKAWRDIYNLSDVFVMSSISEPFGLTALEAAQHDTAISLTNQSGVSEVLTHVLRYDYWDEDTLADQLIALSTSASLRHTLARNVMKESTERSWRTVAKHFLDRYTALEQGARS